MNFFRCWYSFTETTVYHFNIGMLCSYNGSKHLYEKLIIFVGVYNFHQTFLCVPEQSTSDFHYRLI